MLDVSREEGDLWVEDGWWGRDRGGTDELGVEFRETRLACVVED